MHDLLFTDYEAVSRRFYGQDIGVDINSVASLLSLQYHTAYDVLAKDYIQLQHFIPRILGLIRLLNLTNVLSGSDSTNRWASLCVFRCEMNL